MPEIPSFWKDQLQASVTDAERYALDMAARGARLRESVKLDEIPRFHQEMVRAFQQAAKETRARYEAAVGEEEAKKYPYRRRWDYCEHVRQGPSVAYWLYKGRPHMLLCEQCMESVHVHSCNWCGGMYGTPTRIHAVVGSFIVVGAVCDKCYPEGADAPRMRR
jgi:hypothetical protein